MHTDTYKRGAILTVIIVAIVAFSFGILQFLCNTFLFPAVFAGKILKAGGLLFLKLCVYALGFWLLFKLFKAFLFVSLSGFGAGFFLFLIVYALAKLKKK